MAGENWTFWFNMTNFALGMITLLAVAVVIASVGWDLFGLWLRKPGANTIELSKVRLQSISADLRAMWDAEHTMSVPELGLTMADGGEKITPKPESSEEKSPRK
jgi:hypothetical protein